MSDPQDAVPMAERYRRQAQAAWSAAQAAIGTTAYSNEVAAARIEAAGRIAAAMIMADRGESHV